MELVVRFDYGSLVPWVRRVDACAFWLADNLALQGRQGEARELFERLLARRNDVGLLSEQYDPIGGRHLGNFPQALSHVGLVNTARNLTRSGGPAEHRPHAAIRPPAARAV
jgi:GH15 family glucan-1,4-alpha-glucosidase